VPRHDLPKPGELPPLSDDRRPRIGP
jgi:hypothetical protein